MIILGINGWTGGTHDSSAALLVNGELVAFIEEERLSRKRYAEHEPPHRSVQIALEMAGITINEVDIVAYGWDLPGYYARANRRWKYSDMDFLKIILGIVPDRWPELVFIPHHDAHAASAFYSSGFSTASILVIDGVGDHEAISIYRGDKNSLKLVRKWAPPYSLGFFYEAATEYCGFNPYHAGKTMGLAGYSSPLEEIDLISWKDGEIIIPISNDLHEDDIINAWKRMFEKYFGDKPRILKKYLPSHGYMIPKDMQDPLQHSPVVAATVQTTLENIIINLASYSLSQEQSKKLCLAGGVALNCIANSRLIPICNQLHIPPVSNDAGVALGAAYLVAAKNGMNVNRHIDAYQGPNYNSSNINKFLRSCNLKYDKCDDPAERAVKLICDGKVIGWFQGRMEMGPRALGSRSILSLPGVTPGRDHVNDIKGRELWRPFAPSLLFDETVNLFGKNIESPFMLLSFPVVENAREFAYSIVHVDGSTRPHTVADGDGPYGHLLELLKKKTGHGIVLNTSFNAPGEPIVCTPADAVRTFFSSGLDALVIGDFVIEK